MSEQNGFTRYALAHGGAMAQAAKAGYSVEQAVLEHIIKRVPTPYGRKAAIVIPLGAWLKCHVEKRDSPCAAALAIERDIKAFINALDDIPEEIEIEWIPISRITDPNGHKFTGTGFILAHSGSTPDRVAIWPTE